MPTSRLALAIMLAIPAVFSRTAQASEGYVLMRAPVARDALGDYRGYQDAGALTPGLAPSEKAQLVQGAASSLVDGAAQALPVQTNPDAKVKAEVVSAAREAVGKSPRAKPATAPVRVAPHHAAERHKPAAATDARVIEQLRKELASKNAEIAALRAELTASRAAATVQLVPVAKPVERAPAKESPTVIALSGSQLNREGMEAMSAGDYRGAVDKFRRAADLDDAAAIANLGTLYLNGSGVPQDTHQALQLLAQAANRGNRTAAENLGTLCEYGISGVAQNPLRAYQWYEVAARLGSTTVTTAMARIKAQDY